MLGKKLIISITLLNLSLNGASSLPANSEVTARKIGIFSGGLLATHPRDLEITSPFQKSSLKMPTQLARIFKEGTSKQRLTRVYDRNGTPINVWHATSKYTFLPEAIKNLAQRKRTNINNILYIKTMLQNEIPGKTEKPINDKDGKPVKDLKGNLWYIHGNGDNQMSLHDKVALAQWASNLGYTAVIWTGFSKSPDHNYESLTKKLNDPATLKNTKEYIKNLPDINDVTPFEKNVLTDQLK